MNQTMNAAPIVLSLAMIATACTNPTVDPSSTFIAEGRAQLSNGDALANADVRLIRYFHKSKFLRPTVDDLFTCTTVGTACGHANVNLEIEVVMTTKTNSEGRFEMEFKGENIAADNGITDSTGKVEVSNTVLLVVDPNDADGLAGVYSLDHLYQQSDKSWDPGIMKLWDSSATADVGSALTSGFVKFGWNKIARPAGSMVSQVYRLDVRGGGSRLLVRCTEGVDATLGGCISDGNKLRQDLSAFTIYNWYSTNGTFSGYVHGEGVDLRYRSRFTVTGMFQDPTAGRDPVGIAGIWAISSTGAEQALLNTKATDGDPKTRESITGNAKEIYVQLPAGTLVTDSGLLNSVVNNAYNGCVVLEFNTTAFNDVMTARTNGAGWVSKGKFCGGQGADNELSALVSFDTTASMGEIAAWMRFRIEATGTTDVYYSDVGEVAVYKRN